MADEHAERFRTWLSSLWPLAVAVITITIFYTRMEGQVQRSQDELRRIETTLGTRIESAITVGDQREARIYALEADVRILTERVTSLSGISAQLQDQRRSQLSEHNEILGDLHDIRERMPERSAFDPARGVGGGRR